MFNKHSRRPCQGNGSTPLPVQVIIISFIAIACASILLIASTKTDHITNSVNTENISKAAAKMPDTPLGKEDEAGGASWYQISGNNKLLSVTFNQRNGYRWYCTISDEDAILLEEEMNDTATWTARLRPTCEKDTESTVYFDCRKDGSNEPVCIYILKLRTDGSTLRVIGIEEQPEK